MPPAPRRSIRDRLIALTIVPTTALILLWTVAANSSVNDILDLRASADFVEEVGEPLLGMVSALQRERRYAAQRVGEQHELDAPRPVPELEQSEQEADEAIDNFRGQLARTDLDRYSGAIRDRVAEFDAAIDEVVDSRSNLREFTIERDAAMQPYNDAIEAGLRVWDAHTELSDPELTYQADILESLLRARELLAQEHALHTYALAAESLSSDDHAEFSETVGAQRFLYTQIRPDLQGEEREIYDDLIELPTFDVLRDMEDRVIAANPNGGEFPITREPWTASHAVVDAAFLRVEDTRITEMAAESRDAADTLLLQVAAGSILALAVVFGSAVFSARITRDINRRLRSLRQSTLEHAQARLPSVTRRLRAGEEVDVAAEAPEIPVARRDEIGQAVEAFNLAQRTAVEAAVEEARLRDGVRRVFRNVARRTQGLVHRQLGLLDELEKSETDPKSLESLFRIDHLSTQLRRHADNLILLSGTRPDRRQRSALPLQDVVRAASSEVQDYTRINVLPIPPVAVDGHAAGDLIHLLAELLDNAAAFSPPTAPVTIRGGILATGHVIEIEDRGLGMSEGEYTQLNGVLAAAPEFDVAEMREDSRLGMFVVSSIANRYGIQVTLRPSPYNGTQAIVVLPASLLTEPPAEPPAPRQTPGRPWDAAAAHASTAESDTAADPAATAVAVSAPQPPPAPLPEDPVTADADTYKGLPRRRRKRTPAAEPQSRSAAPPPASEPSTRSLEEIQRMMRSYQMGTMRGRAPDQHDTDESDPRDSGR